MWACAPKHAKGKKMISLTAIATVLLAGWLVKKLVDLVKLQASRLADAAVSQTAPGEAAARR
jgi:hypothetical protein